MKTLFLALTASAALPNSSGAFSQPAAVNKTEAGLYCALGGLNDNLPFTPQPDYERDTSWIISSTATARVGFVSNNFTLSTSLKKVSAATLPTALPVSVFGLVATAEQSWVRLEWQAGQKGEFDRYQIERSANGVDFSEWLSIPAINARTYTEYDDMPLMGNNYYRVFGYTQGDKKLVAPVQMVCFEEPEQMPLIAYPSP